MSAGGSAFFSGDGQPGASLTAISARGTASLAGAGNLAIVGASSGTGAGSLVSSGTGTLAATGRPGFASSVSFSGTGALTANQVAARPGTIGIGGDTGPRLDLGLATAGGPHQGD
jgi:hypothetical protein